MNKLIAAFLTISSIALASDVPPPQIALIDVNEGRIEPHCKEKTGAYNFQAERLRAKNKSGTQTWEDIANYQMTRADLFECIAGDQRTAIRDERVATNIVIGALNESLAVSYEVNVTIGKLEQEFRLCDKMPLPADQATMVCGAQQFIYECAQRVSKRAFAKESTREGGAWNHILRTVSAYEMTRRINLMQCAIDNLKAIEDKDENPPSKSPRAGQSRTTKS